MEKQGVVSIWLGMFAFKRSLKMAKEWRLT